MGENVRCLDRLPLALVDRIILLLTVELTMICFLYSSRQAICTEPTLSSRVSDCGRWL